VARSNLHPAKEAVVYKHLLVPLAMLVSGFAHADEIANPLIDYDAFKVGVEEVGKFRESRRITEREFSIMAATRGTVILDARSAEKFSLMHVRGAKNLSLPDITEEELAKVIPSKSTRILIYCNNNFLNEPEAFPSKTLSASLNVYTMNVLFAYGYTNVYELGPLIDIRKTILPFVRKPLKS
jgi:phage shock protein E